MLVRSDLASLTPGKAVAQGNHAGTKLTSPLRKDDFTMSALLDEWEGQTGDGFGTVVTLAVDERTLHRVVGNAQSIGFVAGLPVDPFHPMTDGAVVHAFPLLTCGFVFGRRSLAKIATRDLPWMP